MRVPPPPKLSYPVPDALINPGLRDAAGLVPPLSAEPDAKPFFVGVQWHPERMFAFGLDESPASAPLRQRFFDEVKRKSIA